MSQAVLLTVDCSTTAAKCIAWDGAGNELHSSRFPIELSSPQRGWGEQRPADWWAASRSALREVAAKVEGKSVAAIAVTHQRESFGCFTEQGDALRPGMLWLDSRAGAQVDAFGTERVHQITGKPPNTTPAFYKLLWLKEHEPETLRRAERVADVGGFLSFKLTGLWRTSTASADPLGLSDVSTGQYSDELLATAGLRLDQLCELVSPGRLLGSVSADAAREIGLPYGTPVVAGAGDGQSAGLGAGVVDAATAYLNLGTGAIAGVISESFTPARTHRTMAGAMAGTFANEVFISSGTYLVDWYCANFHPGAISRERLLDTVAGEAAQISPGSEGLMVLPYWNGALTPYWDHAARGAMIGFSGMHDATHVFRAILEGIAYEVRLCIEAAESALDVKVERFVAMGGGARSHLWCQMIADITGRPVVLAGTPEATSLGSAILASVGGGMHSDVLTAVTAMTREGRAFVPDADVGEAYESQYRQYCQLYDLLRPVFGSGVDNDRD